MDIVLLRPLTARLGHLAQTRGELQRMVGEHVHLHFSAFERDERSLDDGGMAQTVAAQRCLDSAIEHGQRALRIEAHRGIEVGIGRDHRHIPRIGKVAQALRQMGVKALKPVRQKAHSVRRVQGDKAPLL